MILRISLVLSNFESGKVFTIYALVPKYQKDGRMVANTTNRSCPAISSREGHFPAQVIVGGSLSDSGHRLMAASNAKI